VVTVEFEEAVQAQSHTLGFEPGIVWVPHPVQNRTAAELKTRAQDAIEPILAMITSAE